MFNRILVALKFTDAGRHAFETAVRLAREHSAGLHIFHALEYIEMGVELGSSQLEGLQEEACARFEKELKPAAEGLSDVQFECLAADPALGICKRGRELQADLIVMGVHQRPDKISLGRIDYVGITILEKAPCPVMLVPLSP